ncbi:MAG: sensor histidine kinase [Mycobacteriales bacterium]
MTAPRPAEPAYQQVTQELPRQRRPAPPDRPDRPRVPLSTRIALVTTVVAVVAALIAGLVSVRLLRRAVDDEARRVLARQATSLQLVLDDQTRGVPQRVATLLAQQGIAAGIVRPGGATQPRKAPRIAAVTAGRTDRLAGGARLSYSVRALGARWWVETRPLVSGGSLVLAQKAKDLAGDLRQPLYRRIGIALGIGAAVAILAGLLLAWRLARPLRRAAAAAHQLASGRRDVQVPPEGPAEVAEVAAALNTLAVALAHSEGRQRDFLLSVSHELRTPLTALRGYAESLADGVVTDAEVPAAGRVMVAEASRLERLVSDLLDLARLGAQEFRIDLTTVDLTDLVRDAAEVWRARCAAEDVPFSAELPAYRVPVVTDPTRVRQILDGLAENALRVTPAGRPIVFALRAEPGWAALEVRDGGPGLTPEDCAVAFDRGVLYARYRGIRKVGTGLGLALVHGFATRLGGTATAGRAVEGGACFTVRLPLR